MPASALTYSVITVCLNSARTIARTIDSVFAQTVAPLEYIFIDGGSTDATLEIIERARIRAVESRCAWSIRVLRQPARGGITEAWNQGLRDSRGEVSCILNSDDWYLERTAERVLGEFSSKPEIDIVLASGNYIRRGASEGKVCHTRPFFVLPWAMTIVHPGCFVRRRLYERIGYYDERYRIAADYDFTYRWRRANVKHVDLREALVNIEEGGLADQNRAVARRELLSIAREYSRTPIFAHLAYSARRVLGR